VLIGIFYSIIYSYVDNQSPIHAHQLGVVKEALLTDTNQVAGFLPTIMFSHDWSSDVTIVNFR
jgi:hypothetical protein